MTDVAGQPEDQVVAGRVGGPRSSLRHGRWTLELRGDEVADIAYDGVMLLRAIRPVVRDQDWNTLPVRLLTPPTTRPAASQDDGMAVEVDLVFESAAITYAGTLTVGLSATELVVSFDGRAQTAFQRNRIGLVVLHPASEAGRPVTVRHSDGTLTQAHWPEQISPHQPFLDIAGFAWNRDNVSAELALLGDVFELEDQRNWTDASFKTYSTPLDRPFPVPVAVGETVQQQARLQVVDHARSPRSSMRSRDVVTIGSRVVGHVPPLSLGASLYPSPAVPAALDPGYATVLVELTDVEERWPALLDAATEQARALAADLDIRLVTGDPAAVKRGVALLHGRPTARIGVFDPDNHLSTGPLWTALRDAASTASFSGELVGGTRAHFTELNRGQQALPDDIPALTFSLTPSMHATEIPHLLDSLATQRTVVENAIRIAAGRPVHVGPITLARRFNAVATSGRPDQTTDALRAVDPLQHTTFAGAWTLASVRALTVSGVAGLTYYETVGDRGLLRDRQEGAASLSPAGRVLALLATLTGQPVLDAAAPDDLAAMPLDMGRNGTDLLLADLSGGNREVLVRNGDQMQTVPLAGWAVAHIGLD